MTRIYKITSEAEWTQARAAGRFDGSAVDRADGYIHFSTADQLADTARRHFSGRGGLTLLAVDADRLGGAVRWEPSRGGALFPHLYGPLPVSAVSGVCPMPDDLDDLDSVFAGSAPPRPDDLDDLDSVFAGSAPPRPDDLDESDGPDR